MTATRNLGDAQSAAYTQTAAAAAGTAVSAAASAGLISASAAGPIGAAIAGIGLAISALIANSGCGPTCVLATNIVNQLEPKLEQNRDAYLSASPRTASMQAAALANFDSAWAWLTSAQACGSPELGDAGKRCISDRARGGKWDWFAYYRDPIADDPGVVSDSGLNVASLANVPALLSEYWFPIALIVVGLLL